MRARERVRAPERVTLTGRHVRLEPIDERHRDHLLAAASEDPATFRYMGTDLSAGPEAWPGYLADALRPEFVTWATVLASTGRAIGSTRFGDISPTDGRLEIDPCVVEQRDDLVGRVDPAERRRFVDVCVEVDDSHVCTSAP